MGKTVESYRIALEDEIRRWKGFAQALRSDNREDFEPLMDTCRNYLDWKQHHETSAIRAYGDSNSAFFQQRKLEYYTPEGLKDFLHMYYKRRSNIINLK